MTNSLEMGKYSSILAVGGDGTYQKVINGMLFHSFREKLPVGLVPNGSGNTLCIALGIYSVDYALDYVCNFIVYQRLQLVRN